MVAERRHLLGTWPERNRNRPTARLQMREIEPELKRLWQCHRAELRERTEPGDNEMTKPEFGKAESSHDDARREWLGTCGNDYSDLSVKRRR